CGGGGGCEDAVRVGGGRSFKPAGAPLIKALADGGLLFRSEPHRHSYPYCWRCHTPLMYYALPSWFIRTTQIKDQLLAENERTNWQPPTIKYGRYGEWVRKKVDWAPVRNRDWGTPPPPWDMPRGA